MAKKKLLEAGYNLRRSFHNDALDASLLDDQTIDDINFSNQINERILEDDEANEEEKMIRALALQEVMATDEESSEFQNVLEGRKGTEDTVASLEKMLEEFKMEEYRK